MLEGCIARKCRRKHLAFNIGGPARPTWNLSWISRKDCVDQTRFAACSLESGPPVCVRFYLLPTILLLRFDLVTSVYTSSSAWSRLMEHQAHGARCFLIKRSRIWVTGRGTSGGKLSPSDAPLTTIVTPSDPPRRLSGRLGQRFASRLDGGRRRRSDGRSNLLPPLGLWLQPLQGREGGLGFGFCGTTVMGCRLGRPRQTGDPGCAASGPCSTEHKVRARRPGSVMIKTFLAQKMLFFSTTTEIHELRCQDGRFKSSSLSKH